MRFRLSIPDFFEKKMSQGITIGDVLIAGAGRIRNDYLTYSSYHSTSMCARHGETRTRKRKIPRENGSREIAAVNKVRRVLIAV